MSEEEEEEEEEEAEDLGEVWQCGRCTRRSDTCITSAATGVVGRAVFLLVMGQRNGVEDVRAWRGGSGRPCSV
jgi:hypothetical protein